MIQYAVNGHPPSSRSRHPATRAGAQAEYDRAAAGSTATARVTAWIRRNRAGPNAQTENRLISDAAVKMMQRCRGCSRTRPEPPGRPCLYPLLGCRARDRDAKTSAAFIRLFGNRRPDENQAQRVVPQTTCKERPADESRWRSYTASERSENPRRACVRRRAASLVPARRPAMISVASNSASYSWRWSSSTGRACRDHARRCRPSAQPPTSAVESTDVHRSRRGRGRAPCAPVRGR